MTGCGADVATSGRNLGDTGKGSAKVAFDVDGERFQGRNVEYAAVPGFCRYGREHKTIEAPEKCGECLAAAGRREDERRLSAGDRRPTERLRPCRRLEDGFEPRAHCRMKRRKRIRSRPRGHANIL